ncbi:MAG: 50S ribosomal protein L23 [Gammaproteobacteria bacterium]|nr:50S ribosomal protein L23 [Gammaproteobacteria bacterium]
MNQERIFNVIVAPHISEKSASNAEKNNQYVFKVAIDAKKPEIKKAIESIFEVSVTNVQTSIAKGKVKRFGQKTGRRKDWKKAYITLAEGSTIEMMSGE